MTLEQLRIFVAVAEREHMTRAAEALRLTQSAVSGAIAALEARHNVALFNRVGRRIELTQDGRIFLDQARSVLRVAEAAELSLLELRGLSRGVMTVHASQTTGAYWLPERLARFHAKYPDIDIKLSLGNTDQVAAAVSSGLAEIGFVEGMIHQPDLVTEQVDLDELLIVVGASHRWSGLRQLKADHISKAEWILRERGSGTRSVFEQALGRIGILPEQLHVTLELPVERGHPRRRRSRRGRHRHFTLRGEIRSAPENFARRAVHAAAAALRSSQTPRSQSQSRGTRIPRFARTA